MTLSKDIKEIIRGMFFSEELMRRCALESNSQRSEEILEHYGKLYESKDIKEMKAIHNILVMIPIQGFVV